MWIVILTRFIWTSLRNSFWSQIKCSPSLTLFCDPDSRSRVVAQHRSVSPKLVRTQRRLRATNLLHEFMWVVVWAAFITATFRYGFGAFHHKWSAEVADITSRLGLDSILAIWIIWAWIKYAESSTAFHHFSFFTHRALYSCHFLFSFFWHWTSYNTL